MSIDNDYVIETRALSKRYGRKLALDNLDLRIPRGRIHAIVGANGAGKSTLFRILMGFMPPTAGEARILGKDSQQLTPADRARIGFVNEEHTLANWMRVSQVAAMQKHQYPRWNQQAYDSVIGHYHVLPEQKVGQLSRGERAGFNLALMLAPAPARVVGRANVTPAVEVERVDHPAVAEERREARVILVRRNAPLIPSALVSQAHRQPPGSPRR